MWAYKNKVHYCLWLDPRNPVNEFGEDWKRSNISPKNTKALGVFSGEMFLLSKIFFIFAPLVTEGETKTGVWVWSVDHTPKLMSEASFSRKISVNKICRFWTDPKHTSALECDWMKWSALYVLTPHNPRCEFWEDQRSSHFSPKKHKG